MYTAYYGLTRNPFELTPDPGVVFMSESHQEALAILRYGVMERKGFLLLTGNVGTGKTTLLHLLVRSLGSRIQLCQVSNPSLSIRDFYFTLAAAFSLSPYAGNKALFLQELAAFLERSRKQGKRVVLIIDEAHVLSVELLEEIRLLSNLQGPRAGILSIFLVGQPELNERLAHEQLLPLRQRISIRFHLESFSQEETARYIGFRLQQAGGSRTDIFTAPALELIHRCTAGVPRLINTVCDQALLAGFADSRPVITPETIRACVRELRIPGEAGLLPLPRRRFPAWFTVRPRGKLLWAGLALLLLIMGGSWVWRQDVLPRALDLIRSVF